MGSSIPLLWFPLDENCTTLTGGGIHTHTRVRACVCPTRTHTYIQTFKYLSLIYREAVVAVDRTSQTETEEFLPQMRSRLYGITTTTTHCPQGANRFMLMSLNTAEVKGGVKRMKVELKVSETDTVEDMKRAMR